MRSLLSVCAGAMLIAACSATPPASPAQMDRCTKLYATWYRYGQHATFHHTGQRARAEIALEDCRAGRYDQGMMELEELLRRNRLPTRPQAPGK